MNYQVFTVRRHVMSAAKILSVRLSVWKSVYALDLIEMGLSA